VRLSARGIDRKENCPKKKKGGKWGKKFVAEKTRYAKKGVKGGLFTGGGRFRRGLGGRGGAGEGTTV